MLMGMEVEMEMEDDRMQKRADWKIMDANANAINSIVCDNQNHFYILVFCIELMRRNGKKGHSKMVMGWGYVSYQYICECKL
jgi:hypothetical protein